MCKITDAGVLGLDDECCGDDPDDCLLTTVEGDLLKETCDNLIHNVTLLRDIVDTPDDGLLIAKYVDVQLSVAELTQQVVEYGDPDAGLEPL